MNITTSENGIKAQKKTHVLSVSVVSENFQSAYLLSLQTAEELSGRSAEPTRHSQSYNIKIAKSETVTGILPDITNVITFE